MSFEWQPTVRRSGGWLVFEREPVWVARTRLWQRRFLQSPWARGLAALVASAALHALLYGVVGLPWPKQDVQHFAGLEETPQVEVQLPLLSTFSGLDRGESADRLQPPAESEHLQDPLTEDLTFAIPQAPEVESEAPALASAPPAPDAQGPMQATFMGATGRGVRFCIVADRSGSMRGRKLDFVRHQILQTVAAMQPQMRFQVILFGSNALAFGRDWRHPREDYAELQAWLSGVGAEGDTYPTRAISQALAMTPMPDVIFFLTDGDFPERVADHVATLNTAGVVIQTLAFLDRTGEPQLRRIARDSGGEYRYLSDF